ncbi:MAG: regulatory protein RecX, partial [Brachymonas sp.]|nr:regulatory protein RecX [Brachymonas sp.]
VTAALDELQAKGFLNDQRTAEALLHRQADRLGAARLRHELQRKGIDESISADLLQDLADNEQERAFALWQKKFGTPPATPAERARHMRFLASRGFSGEVVHKVLRQAQAHPDAENAKR